jgi:hypothetical protein
VPYTLTNTITFSLQNAASAMAAAPNDVFGMSASAIPEPTSFITMLTGALPLVALGFQRRHRRAKARG